MICDTRLTSHLRQLNYVRVESSRNFFFKVFRSRRGKMQFSSKTFSRLNRVKRLDDWQRSCARVLKQWIGTCGKWFHLLRDLYKMRKSTVLKRHWSDYIEDCRNRHSETTDWSESTVNRLRSSVFQILHQAGYLSNTRDLELQRVQIDRCVLSYLETADEQYVLKCIMVGE